MRVGLVGMRELPEPDVDEAPALAALRAAGMDARVVHWDSDDPAHDPARFDVCVLRATWDYYRRPGRFLEWVRRAEGVTVLRNPAATVEWNMHKGYLLELERAGVGVVPTVVVARGSGVSLGSAVGGRGWSEVVIKPAVSAASWRTRRFGVGDEAAAWLRAESAERDTLVQPFVREVESGGEVSVMWIGGAVTHAVRKRARFHGSEERVEACAVTEAHRGFAARVLCAAGREAAYARVDVIERGDGSLVLSELELIEPSLYFAHSAEGLARFVEVVGGLAG